VPLPPDIIEKFCCKKFLKGQIFITNLALIEFLNIRGKKVKYPLEKQKLMLIIY